MQLRNGKCYISEVTAWWNANKAKTADVQTIMMAVAMNWMSQECLRRLMWSSYACHLVGVKKAEEAQEEEEEEEEEEESEDESDDGEEEEEEESDDESDDGEEEDVFECPECYEVLRGDAANDERVWIATKCECGDGEYCANCGYDVCMECEDDCCEYEASVGNARYSKD